jgi:hypothetical protein
MCYILFFSYGNKKEKGHKEETNSEEESACRSKKNC